ncbi:MAG: hypothetical protein ACRDUA_06175, partial [Micromonosporaceae bacterium]
LQGFADQAAEAARLAAAAVADVVASLRAGEIPAGPVVVPVHGPELAAALGRVSAAASTEADSPLNVVLLDIAGSQVSAVATDRYWLAMWSIPIPGVHVAERRVAIPRGEIDGLVDWLSRQGTVRVSIGPESARISGEDEERVVAAVADRFPAYRLLIDDQSSGRVTVEREPLLRLLTGDASPVRVAVGSERLSVSPDNGVEGSHLSAITTGEPIRLGFSTTLLRTAVAAIVGSAVTMSYQAPDRAVRVTSAYQRNFTALVMPVRLDR